MDARGELVREMVLLALGIGLTIALTVAGVLWLGGLFTWLWYERAILAAALFIVAADVMVLPRILRTSPMRGPLYMWRRTDRTQGCSVALLIGMVALSLMLCSALLNGLGWR